MTAQIDGRRRRYGAALAVWVGVGVLLALSVTPWIAVILAPITVGLAALGTVRYRGLAVVPGLALGVGALALFVAMRADYKPCSHEQSGTSAHVCGGVHREPWLAGAAVAFAVAAGALARDRNRRRRGSDAYATRSLSVPAGDA